MAVKELMWALCTLLCGKGLFQHCSPTDRQTDRQSLPDAPSSESDTCWACHWRTLPITGGVTGGVAGLVSIVKGDDMTTGPSVSAFTIADEHEIWN